MGKKINDIKVTLNHRLDDRFTATIKLIGFTDKEIHLIAHDLISRSSLCIDMGLELDRKLADFYLNR